MKVTKEKLDNYEVALTIEVEAEKLTKAKKTACKNFANRYDVPGFRKGKAPQHIIEQHMGKEAIMDETANILIQQTVEDALKEENLTPIDFNDMKPEVVTCEEGKDFVYKVTFTPYPEVKLGEYKGLDIKKEVEEITDADVDKQVENLLDHHATLIDAKEGDAVEDGDFITLDFEGFIKGEAFDGGSGKSYPLRIGSGTFIPGFEDQLIGAKVNEERDVKVTFPEDYHDQDYAGEDAVFKCKIISIKHRELPELNDEFAEKVSKFKTVEELKADIKNNLEKSAEQEAKELQGQQAVEKATENMTVDVPPAMIETRINQLVNELSLRLQTRGTTLAYYLEKTNNDLDQLRESYRKNAEKEVLTDLMLEAVAKAENIEVEPKEIEYEVAVMAATYGVPPKQIVKILRENRQFSTVAANVRRRKAVKFIIDNIKGNEVEKSEKVAEKTETEKIDKSAASDTVVSKA